ncbi:MAG: hypothetical protein A3F70_00315 [Acidobacteria bacterium RIFCSPLOWO2_12_FULL_67_14]|nr:MAG: hypothetical protein A3F70_00315 [Acidobacteria bacterium RIFCSPLOWO2_12_FULL_67_14]
MDRHLERHGRAFPGLTGRQLDRRAQRAGTLVCQKRAPDAFDGRRDRWEVDHNLIGEAAGVGARLDSSRKTERASAKRPEDVPAHDLWIP